MYKIYKMQNKNNNELDRYMAFWRPQVKNTVWDFGVQVQV